MAVVAATVGTTNPGIQDNTAAWAISVPTAPTQVTLSSAQTGNGDSTNTLDRGGSTGAALLKITSTVGATPTVTVNIMGSADGTDFGCDHIGYHVVLLPAIRVCVALSQARLHQQYQRHADC